jgi:opacity protein-like surface antigen
MSFRTVFGVSAMALGLCSTALAADSASGTIGFKSASGTIKHGCLVRGPDEMDPSHMVLRIYLSADDISAKVKACKDLSCADGAMGDGAMVDFSDARHLGYAVRLNNERMQYSGGTDAGAFKLTTNKPDHLAGAVHIDDSAAGGAKVDATFDLTLAATFSK